MALVRKALLPPGDYESPDGAVRVSTQRIRHWIEQGKAMLGLGMRIPCCWGHQPKAKPATIKEVEELEYWKSKFNAGYLTDLEEDYDGTFMGHLDLPGLDLDPESGCLIDSQTKTAIGEVSIAFDDFTDGTGKVWPDAVIHVALTPHPVWHGQEGFTEQSLQTGLRLSLAQHLTRFATGEYPVAEEKKDDKGGDVASATDLKKVLELLAAKDIIMPEDTTDENFMERLCIVLTALSGHGGTKPPEPPEEEQKEMKVEEEPAMMSLEKRMATDPIVAALVNRVDREAKVQRERKIVLLVKRGLPVATANKLRQQASAVRLSLSATGDVEESEVDRTIALLEESLPPADVYATQSGSSPVVEEMPPEGLTSERTSQIANGLARAMGIR